MSLGFGSSIRRAAVVAIATAMSASVVAVLPVAAAPPSVTYGLSVGTCTVSGEAPSSILMRLVHQDASGHRLGRADIQVEADGDWSIGCLPGGPIKPGHRLVAKDGDTTLRTFVVPPFSFRVDRATDVLRVSGPPGATLHFILDTCIPGEVTCYGGQVDGDFDTDPSTGKFEAGLLIDARGGDRITLQWDNPTTTDFLERRQYVPYMQVERGSARVRGAAQPGASVHLKLKRANGTLRGAGSDTASGSGSWSARFRHDGSNVNVAAGNRVKGDHAADGVLDVMATSVSVNLGADTAHGTCYPHGKYGMRIREPGGTGEYTEWSNDLGPTGSFDASGLTQVQSGWVIHLWCASRKGDVVYRRSVVP